MHNHRRKRSHETPIISIPGRAVVSFFIRRVLFLAAAVLPVFLPLAADAVEFPLVQEIENGSLSWTNIDEITLSRVVISTATATPNTSTIYVVRADITNNVASEYSSSHKFTIWSATNSPLRILNPGDKVEVFVSTTNAAYATIEATIGQTIGSGGSGTGSGFPLIANQNAGGFSITNFATLQGILLEFSEAILGALDVDEATIDTLLASMLGTNLNANGFGFLDVGFIGEINPPAEAFLKHDGSGYVHEYGIRVATNRLGMIVSQTYSNLPTLYPGYVAYVDTGSDVGSSYMIWSTLEPTNYAPYTGTSFPWPGEGGDSTNYWRRLVKVGATGLTGASGSDGDDGLDGAGNIQVGLWDNSKTYTWPGTNSEVWVRWEGRVYVLIDTNSSTGVNPTSAAGTNDWAIVIDKGEDGTITVNSNLVWRETWDSGSSYNTNDWVNYDGNKFYVGETNQQPPIGVSPSVNSNSIGINSAYWTFDIGRGMKGDKGDDGDTINTYSYYNHYTNITFATNLSIDGEADFEHRLLSWTGTDAGGTNVYGFVGSVPVGTNDLIDIDGELYYVVNGVTNPLSGALYGITVTTNGTGNVVTNVITTSGSNVEIQMGTISGGNSATPYDMGNTGTNWTIDLSSTDETVLKYTQNTNITDITAISDTNDLAGVIIILDVSTSHSIAFPSSITWAEGSAPTDATNEWHTFAIQVFRQLKTWASLGGSL